MNSIQFNGCNESPKFVYMGRQVSFSNDIMQKFPTKKGTAICHRVSFNLMANGFINALNFFLYNFSDGHVKNQPELAGETVHYIRGMIGAVTDNYSEILASISGEEENTEDELGLRLKSLFADKEELAYYQVWLVKIEECLASLDTDTIIQNLYLTEIYINRILDALNNEAFNLQVGSSSWNSSLGNAFDPFLPPIIEDDKCVLSEIDSAVLTMLLHATKGGGSEFDESAVKLYATVVDDEFYLYQSCNIKSLIKDPEPCLKPITYYDFLQKKFVDFEI